MLRRSYYEPPRGKTNNVVSEQVRHKPGCAVTETGLKLEISDLRRIVQVNLIITLSLGSMKTDHVISEPCYNEVIYNRHIAK